NSLRKNRRLEMSNLLMFSDKKWTVKGGFQSLYRSNHSLQQNNFIGTFTFSSLADYIAGRPLQFTQRRGNPLLDVDQLEVASFIQNDWKMTPKFNLSFGARYEAQTNISDHDNIDPRIALAYQLTKTMVLRGGAGAFHQRLDEQIVEGLFRLDGTRQQQIIILRPAFPDPFLGGNTALVPITRRTQASDLVTPYTTDASVSLEKSLPKGLGLTFSWYTSRGVHLYRSRNTNAPLPGSDVVPDSSQGPVFQLESTGNSKSNNYTIGWQKRLRNKWNLRLFGNYTLGYTKNDTDGWQSLPVNSYDMRSEWGRAGLDVRHRFFTAANWTMPLGLNITQQVNWNSSRPYTITTGRDDNNDGIINDRPIDPLTDKMIARNTGVGAGSFNINLSVQKTVPLKGSEKSAPDTRAGNNGRNGVNNFAEPQLGSNRQNTGPTMTIRAYFQNLLNTVQYGNYVGTMTSPFFGHAISTARPARQIELALRFNF